MPLLIFTSASRTVEPLRVHRSLRGCKRTPREEGEGKMFGFIIGTVCLIALLKVLRRGYGYGWSHGCGPCGAGYDGSHHGRFGGGFGRRWMLRWLFERLETTPGQERVILQAIERLTENRAAIHEELKQS